MNRFNRKAWIAALGAGAVASLAMLPSVHAELVYDNGATTEPTQVTSQVDDRAALRQTLDASQKAQITLQAQAPAAVQVQNLPVTAPAVVARPAPATVVVAAAAPAAAPAPVVVAPAAPVMVAAPAVALPAIDSSAVAPTETQNLSRSEMLRRERLRQELKNEDALQTRLEELRLKDEQKRTGQILGTIPTGDEAAAVAAPVAAPAPAPAPALQTQALTAPVTEHPGVVQAVPTLTPGPQVASLQGSSSAEQIGAVGTSTARATDAPSDADRATFSLSGRAGISNFTSSNAGYNISPQFSTGIAASVAATDYVSIELGYTYSQYGVALATTNSYYYGASNPQTLQMNQNVMDAGVKINLLGPDSKIRPFVTGGFGYSKGYVNYNSTILSYINANPSLQGLGTDYDVTQYLGYVGAGADVKLTKSISIGVDFKYFDVLSSNQNNNFNNYAFYGNPYAAPTPDKSYVGSSLATANFYTLMAGVSFSL
ncbi:MAG: OmpW family outer membrane protein [Oligoflexia bacterium]|nr:OmpW family outer membrane protein [Oligoflexia bacterium]